MFIIYYVYSFRVKREIKKFSNIYCAMCDFLSSCSLLKTLRHLKDSGIYLTITHR